MQTNKTRAKFKEWLKHYFIAEILGTLISLAFAYITYRHSHSYILAAGAGLLGEGIGFYGYFIITELLTNYRSYKRLKTLAKLKAIVAKSSTNLIVEFVPAEIVDSIFVRPLLMFYVPQQIKPYTLGFIVGKFGSDIIFYIFAILGYEVKNRLRLFKDF